MSKNKMITLIAPILFILFGFYIALSTRTMSQRDSYFPMISAVLIIVVAAIQLIKDLRQTEHPDRFKNANLGRVLLFVIALVLYTLLIRRIGFVLDTLWLTAFTIYALDYRNHKIVAIASVLITAAVFVIFKVLLRVPLPTLIL